MADPEFDDVSLERLRPDRAASGLVSTRTYSPPGSRRWIGNAGGSAGPMASLSRADVHGGICGPTAVRRYRGHWAPSVPVEFH